MMRTCNHCDVLPALSLSLSLFFFSLFFRPLNIFLVRRAILRPGRFELFPGHLKSCDHRLSPADHPVPDQSEWKIDERIEPSTPTGRAGFFSKNGNAPTKRFAAWTLVLREIELRCFLNFLSAPSFFSPSLSLSLSLSFLFFFTVVFSFFFLVFFRFCDWIVGWSN